MSPAPRMKLPPWLHTMTGSGCADEPVGVQTLSVRQSSLTGSTSAVSGWMHHGPGLAASRTPGQAGMGAGGCQRNGPTGGSA